MDETLRKHEASRKAFDEWIERQPATPYLTTPEHVAEDFEALSAKLKFDPPKPDALERLLEMNTPETQAAILDSLARYDDVDEEC